MRWPSATRDRAERVIAADAAIDALQREIEERAVLTIARRQPMAVDLREIVSALRIANDLERIGDLAKNIAKRVMPITGDFHPQKLIRGVEHMAALVLGPAQAGARRLCQPRPRQGDGGVERRRGDRRHVHLAVPRAAHLHDGRPAQHHVLHPSDVLAPRTSSAWATTPPTSPRPCITWSRAAPITDERPKGDTTWRPLAAGH